MYCGWCEVNKVTGNVPIQLEHIDGDSKNNSLDNLKLLCPNCHSLTPTYGYLNKGNGRSERKKYRDFLKKKTIEELLREYNNEKDIKEPNRKTKLEIESERLENNGLSNNEVKHYINLRKVNRPSYKDLLIDIGELGYEGTGRKYGVSGTSIKKWIKWYKNHEI